MGCACSIQLVPGITSSPQYISHPELHNLLETQRTKNNYIIIDLRDECMDYDGGHIDGSIPISHEIFHNKIPEIVKNYNTRTKLIFCDMYGSISGRSNLCSQHYYNYKREIVSNYSRKEAKSYYYDNETRIEINCDSETISNLPKQEIFVLQGGVFELVNSSFANIIHNFDESKWEQLEIAALHGGKKWYHKNEYFAETKFAEFAELKQQTKSTSFKAVASTIKSIRYDYHTSNAIIHEFDEFEIEKILKK